MATSFLDLLTQNQPSLQTRQALLVLGLQNDFISPSGRLPVDTSSGFVQRIQEMVPIFRENAGDIVWISTCYHEDRIVNDPVGEGDVILLDMLDSAGEESDDSADEVKDASAAASKARASRHKSRALDLLKKMSSRRHSIREPSSVPVEEDETFLSNTSAHPACCIPNTDGAKFNPEVEACIDSSADLTVVATNYSAFNSTALLINLRAKLITELYICGCITNISVYATALDAARHGIAINIVHDCLGYRKVLRHEEALKQMTEVMGANLISSEEITTVLTAPIEIESSRSKKKKTQKSKEDTDLNELVGNMSLNQHPFSPPENSFRKKASLAALRQAATRLATASSKQEPMPNARDEPPSGMTKSKIRMRSRKKPLDEKKDTMTDPAASSDLRVGKESSRPRPSSAVESSSKKASTSITSPEKEKETLSQKASRVFPSLKLAKSQVQLATESKTARSPVTPTRPKSFALAQGSQSVKEEQDKARPHSLSAMTSTKKPQSLATFPTLGPNDRIGEGDSCIIYHFFPENFKRTARSEVAISDEIFSLLHNEVKWQKMFHAQGEVPRLVCAQGDFGKDGSMPIYRHPSDTALPLLHFSPSVQLIKEQVQKIVKHPVNHVLIQLYRSGTDCISEHSDKTLDIVRGSSIVNVSFGAQRTMRLRTKRSAKLDKSTVEAARTTQRIPMPHNSMFVLGEESNQRWLHGILPDKRLDEERSAAEKAYCGMRISLTFRHIGTFIDGRSSVIWGQGATTKIREEAIEVINNDDKKTQEIIRAFGTENQSTNFDWKAVYGGGFDVLHFRKPPRDEPIFFTSHNSIANSQVAVCLSELDIAHTTYSPPPPFDKASTTTVQIGYRDSDTRHAEIFGAVPILLYLDRYHQFDRSEQGKPATALAYQVLFKVESLHQRWTNLKDKEETPDSILEMLDELDDINDMHGQDYIAGNRLSIADCAMWPMLDTIIENWDSWSTEKFPRLSAYYTRIWTRKKSFGKLRKTLPRHA
ncbi:hypothetical protein EJ05DRAFT_438577 [Pseudovirgaria hyperparasitica]|uniref:Fe2OG dioxygenase domain-containing protein n=1 Tax=Pseudovirgaria hyperparasitica TaxID=470096 RepID=A0A6A6W6K6_9PEZI|nr:uncharacterized protein EJ05DRAFT_438577 [Pseudovirgaria hyperparasitica]KAF2758518.1 hypothetical protein EJ05DRAFT_438577 [Pseudovirgaria hyperparasitica]